MAYRSPREPKDDARKRAMLERWRCGGDAQACGNLAAEAMSPMIKRRMQCYPATGIAARRSARRAHSTLILRAYASLRGRAARFPGTLRPAPRFSTLLSPWRRPSSDRRLFSSTRSRRNGHAHVVFQTEISGNVA